MRASSDSIAQLAAAMAKAQLELTNPAKTLTAVLERGRNGNLPLSYRYAPLSAGLDILRKTLGKYELAVIQTTHINGDRGLVLLTTTIAHGSGEWVSALWPVCHVADIGHPKLMGAALTYARRYCLFTMVGLAGEDDLDAPELQTPREQGASSPTAVEGIVVHPEAEPKVEEVADLGRDRTTTEPPIFEAHPLMDPDPTPAADPAAASRKRKYTRRMRSPLTSPPRLGNPARDLAQIQDADALLRWALESLPTRNKLDEARRAEFDAAFLARVDAIGNDPELLLAFRPNGEVPEFESSPAPPAI